MVPKCTITLRPEAMAVVDEIRRREPGNLSRAAIIRRSTENELARLKAAEAKAKEQAE